MSDLIEQARALHRVYPVVDGHADSILMVLEGKRALAERSDLGHVDWPRALEAGVACTVQTAWPGAPYFSTPATAAQDALRPIGQALDGILNQLEASGGEAVLVRTAEQITAAHTTGKLAVLLNIEGAEAIGRELSPLRNFYRLGVRMMGLVWSHRNQVADGVDEEPGGGGLSKFGRDVVREMNRLGMVIDLAHITPKGFFDTLELSEQPVLFTHGNCMALWEHPRNLTDEQIKALAARGGVFGISFVASFMNREKATLATVADHIDHVVQVLGSADHVAYGSDFDGASMPPGLEDVTRLPDLTAELLRRGYGEADLGKILGGNYIRVFSRVLG